MPERRTVVLLGLLLGCGPTSGSSTSDSGSSGSSGPLTGGDTIGQTSSESTGSAVPWVPDFGRYSKWQKPGMTLVPMAALINVLEFRDDGTLTIEELGGTSVCLLESALHWEARWVVEPDRIRLEGEEPGSVPELWPSVVEAWLEPGAEATAVNLFFLNMEGDLVGPGEYTPGCPCLPDPTMCCEIGCEITLETCPESQFSAWCEPP
jgi:hypothetical protein